MNRDGTRYSARVLALFAQLPGAGALSAGAGVVASGESVAIDRGAWVRLEARIDGGKIVDCVFRAWGCPHTLAAAAWVTAEARTHGLSVCAAIDASRLMRELAAPAEKMGRLLVVEDALRALLGHARAVQ